MNLNSPKSERKPAKTKKAAPRLRDRLRQETAQAILQVAEEILATEGIHATRMDAIAAQAGVSVGTLYNHFADRDALLGALIDSRRAELLARVDAVLAERAAHPFAAQLEAALQALLEHIGQHRALMQILMDGEAPQSKRSSRLALRARLQTLCDRGVAKRALRPAHVALYPMLLLSIVRSAVLSSVELRAGDIVDLFLRGARAVGR